MELDLPSSKVSLSPCAISNDVLPLTRSDETVYQDRLSEDLWFTATVSDNPVSSEVLPAKGLNATEPSFPTLNGSKQFNTPAVSYNQWRCNKQ